MLLKGRPVEEKICGESISLWTAIPLGNYLCRQSLMAGPPLAEGYDGGSVGQRWQISRKYDPVTVDANGGIIVESGLDGA
jgi:hypothetical protein